MACRYSRGDDDDKVGSGMRCDAENSRRTYHDASCGSMQHRRVTRCAGG